MATQKEHTQTVRLKDSADWSLLIDVTAQLRSRWELTEAVGESEADGTRHRFTSIEDVAEEHPYPPGTSFWFHMVRPKPSVNQLDAFFPGVVECNINGSDETEVLGVAEALRRYIGRWEPSTREPEPTTSEPEPKTRWWREEWRWIAITALAAVAGVIVALTRG